jgi:hypothetical protein
MQSMATDRILGKRFSHVYLERGEPRADSARARHRVSSWLWGQTTTAREGLGSLIERELGIELPSSGYGTNWSDYFSDCELRDFLDTITITYEHFNRGGRTTVATTWLQEVKRIFHEENLRYQIDPQGGVHFSIDEEFERGMAASIAALQAPRYKNVLNSFEQSDAALSNLPPDGKGAIRAVFSSAEGLFRLMFPSSPRLTANEIDRHFAPQFQSLFANDPAATGSASKIMASFKDWVEAAHFYRHEPGREEIAQPPLTLAINMVSLGATYIRWLAEIDSQIISKPS